MRILGCIAFSVLVFVITGYVLHEFTTISKYYQGYITGIVITLTCIISMEISEKRDTV